MRQNLSHPTNKPAKFSWPFATVFLPRAQNEQVDRSGKNKSVPNKEDKTEQAIKRERERERERDSSRPHTLAVNLVNTTQRRTIIDKHIPHKPTSKQASNKQ